MFAPEGRINMDFFFLRNALKSELCFSALSAI